MVSRVQNGGLSRIAAAIAALTWWVQWGTGSGAAAAANAVTTTTTTEARTAATSSQTTGSVTGDTHTLTGTITAAGARTITEVGSFDAVGSGSPPTGGNMDYYADFTGIPLLTGESIAFTLNTKFA